ncbi:DUF397 domain-containing protein [Streptomyces marincola]|uniref:DUF397 domain-containing protein n=1 Tax=Streptomyces marincola TaxID=2878388 RepID=A0A1W7D0G6_9ACTN|nr:DUF397 domain-containing protein [Streptomyces marincola]ARQ70514.1 DUF397 domain-containing protein [Streptomyces marincola]
MNGGRRLDLAAAEWVVSSYSGGDGGQCVEVSRSFAGSGAVPVRDSKAPTGGVLVFGSNGWASFVAAVGRGGFAN